MNTFPDAPCKATWKPSPRGGLWRITVPRCPLCGKSHYHGGGDDPDRPSLGHRVSHCDERIPPAGYCLVAQGAPQTVEESRSAPGAAEPPPVTERDQAGESPWEGLELAREFYAALGFRWRDESLAFQGQFLAAVGTVLVPRLAALRHQVAALTADREEALARLRTTEQERETWRREAEEAAGNADRALDRLCQVEGQREELRNLLRSSEDERRTAERNAHPLRDDLEATARRARRAEEERDIALQGWRDCYQAMAETYQSGYAWAGEVLQGMPEPPAGQPGTHLLERLRAAEAVQGRIAALEAVPERILQVYEDTPRPCHLNKLVGEMLAVADAVLPGRPTRYPRIDPELESLHNQLLAVRNALDAAEVPRAEQGDEQVGGTSNYTLAERVRLLVAERDVQARTPDLAVDHALRGVGQVLRVREVLARHAGRLDAAEALRDAARGIRSGEWRDLAQEVTQP